MDGALRGVSRSEEEEQGEEDQSGSEQKHVATIEQDGHGEEQDGNEPCAKGQPAKGPQN